MSFEQIIQNAKQENKGDITIYRYYVGLLRDCPEALESGAAYAKCKEELAKIFEI